jgi:hypothetical protein
MSLIIGAVPVVKRAWAKSTKQEKFDFARLVLSGALAGVAVFGTIFWLAGCDQSQVWNTTGAIAGVAAATALKFAHFA